MSIAVYTVPDALKTQHNIFTPHVQMNKEDLAT